MSSPYPLLRPYYKGHSREEDEKLSNELFYGTSTVVDKKTGRCRHDYPDGLDERRAIEALKRLLVFSCGDLDEGILGGLVASLDPGGSFGRRLVFEPRKRKRPADSATDLQIALRVRSLHHRLGKKEAAVTQAMADFDLSRKTVFEAMKRIRAESPWLEV